MLNGYSVQIGKDALPLNYSINYTFTDVFILISGYTFE